MLKIDLIKLILTIRYDRASSVLFYQIYCTPLKWLLLLSIEKTPIVISPIIAYCYFVAIQPLQGNTRRVDFCFWKWIVCHRAFSAGTLETNNYIFIDSSTPRTVTDVFTREHNGNSPHFNCSKAFAHLT